MTGPKLHYASQFIIAAMDEWGRPVTPTTGTPVYLKQDYDALQAKVRELEERLKEQKQLTEHAEASEEYARAEWTKDLARLADLEAKLRKAEERLEMDHEGEGGAWHPTRRQR